MSSIEMPEQGEIVIATVTKIMDHGAYVTLDEYDNMQGFLHISEIAPGWIRSVARYVKMGEKKVLLVKRVNTGRSDIDLSLKQISIDQKKKKLMEVKKYQKGKTLLESTAKKANISQDEIDKIEGAMYTKFDSVYDAFVALARNGSKEIEGLGISKEAIVAIKEIASKIRPPSVEIRGVAEITNRKSNGVETIKKLLAEASKEKKIEITYLGAPKYRLAMVANDFKSAEKSLKPIIETLKRSVEKDGTFKFSREESKKTKDVA